jgi:hypothetical protein
MADTLTLPPIKGFQLSEREWRSLRSDWWHLLGPAHPIRIARRRGARGRKRALLAVVTLKGQA